jgi:hypothetical protein
MVPVLDMVNHSASPTAFYEESDKDEAVLSLRPGCKAPTGTEITISYGDDKSAAEMLFTYGFIDEASMTDSITLTLNPFEDDPLARIKLYTFKSLPTVEISRTDGRIVWKSPFAWFMCLNEEDGLDFKVLQETGGSRQLVALWQDSDVTAQTHSFETLVKDHPLSEVFKLRVVTVVENRVRAQLDRMSQGASTTAGLLGLEDSPAGIDNMVRGECLRVALLLQGRETMFLESALEALEEQVRMKSFSIPNRINEMDCSSCWHAYHVSAPTVVLVAGLLVAGFNFELKHTSRAQWSFLR